MMMRGGVLLAAMLAASGAVGSTIIPAHDGGNVYRLNFRVENTDVQFFQQFSYDVTLKLDFGSRDPFGDASAFHQRLSGTIDGNAGLFGVDNPAYLNGILSGYSTSAQVHWIYENGRMRMGNRPLLETEWGPDPDVYQENAFGFVGDIFFEGDGTVFVDAHVIAFRDRFFADQSFGADQIRITNLNVPVVAPPSAVPEPATWAMMIGGFGLVGGAIRRRTISTAHA